MEVFENIALNFRRVFSQLSEGGSADLLLDEDNPLEGGLMIQAKPVGKNLQYIELMSGGEKTLTALAFIFAIQRYQPAPFYVLDEIDMFLDDDNVRKVSELIKESSKEAQFVVVSLKDSLMTSASQLFGVSIEEGVSKIVGVELEEVGS
jgi:chromosome segregation protein